MKRDIAQKWVDALRSGEYEQTQQVLCRITEDGPRHCCLGVLCDLAIKDNVDIITQAHMSADGVSQYIQFDTQGFMPPDSVYNWSELDQDYMDRYAGMNDSDLASFDEIATAIENDHLKGGE
jgi:hypothetical protein